MLVKILELVMVIGKKGIIIKKDALRFLVCIFWVFRKGDVGVLKFLATSQNYLLVIEVRLIKGCFENQI